MPPFGSTYQLIVTDQQQDDAIRALYRTNGWTLHAKALNDQNLKTILLNQDESVVSFIQSTCGEINHPTIHYLHAQPNKQTANAVAESLNTDEFVIVKNEHYFEPEHIKREPESEPLGVQNESDTENEHKLGDIQVADRSSAATDTCSEPIHIKREPESEPLGLQSESKTESELDLGDSEDYIEHLHIKREPESVPLDEQNEAETESELELGESDSEDAEVPETSSSETDTCSEPETDKMSMALQQKYSVKHTADLHHSDTIVNVLQKPSQVPVTTQSNFSAKAQRLYDQYVQVTKMFYSTVSQMSREQKLSEDSASVIAVTTVDSLVKTLQTAEELMNTCTVHHMITTKTEEQLMKQLNNPPKLSKQGVMQNEKLRLHYLQPGKSKFPCSHCSKGFPGIRALRRHMILTHKDKPPPVIKDCHVCGKEFETKDELVQHRANEHPERNAGRKKKYHCKQCGAFLLRPETLKQHDMITHTEKDKFPCDICGKVFSKAVKVNTHKRYAHLTHTHSCEICGKTFENFRKLSSHKKRHNLDNKKHMCDHCGKSFFQREALTIHLRVHTGEKPYKCRFCDYASTTSANTRKHEKIHKKDTKEQADVFVAEQKDS